jgi:geranylgeranyl reductase family protein
MDSTKSGNKRSNSITSRHYDVIVIGGGPAGSSAARTLASQDFSVAIIDKKDFPREKLCGGLLTQRSEKIYHHIFTQPWDSIIQFRSQGLRIYHGDTLLNQLENYKPFAFTKRKDFDAFLLEQAIASGAHAFLGQRISTLNINNNEVVLADDTQLTADCIIGADGVNSMVAQTLFGMSFNKEKTAFGLEIELPREETDIEIDKPEIAFGHINWGYAWIFPKKHTYTVGIGGLYGANQDFKEKLARYSRQRFSKTHECKVKGHFIPFGEYRKTPGRGSILLSGDAAGLVEPITGEGIAFAMQSGHFAALACAQSLQAGDPTLAYRFYYPLFRQVSRDIRSANKIKHFIFRKGINRLFLSLLPRHQGALKLHVDLMSADISYPRYAGKLFAKTTRALISRTFRFTSRKTS